MSERVLPGLGERPVEIPEGGGFLSTGLVAPWTAAMMFTFYATTDHVTYNGMVDAEEQVNPDDRREKGVGYDYFFYSKDAAARAHGLLEGAISTYQVWRFKTVVEKILFASPTAAAKWNNPVVANCTVKTPASKKYRYAYHQIALPSAVAAMATFYGYDNPGFDLGELLDSNVTITDKFFNEMCGDNSDIDSWLGSILGTRRAALWTALGEDDLTKYQLTGTTVIRNKVEKPSDFATESPQLNKCLRIAGSEWLAPIWCKVALVPDPWPDNAYMGANDEVKHPSIPAITAVYASETEARTAWEAELKAMGLGESVATASTTLSQPTVIPGQWAKVGLEIFQAFMASPPSAPMSGVLGISDIAVAKREDINCDVTLIRQWREWFRAQGVAV